MCWPMVHGTELGVQGPSTWQSSGKRDRYRRAPFLGFLVEEHISDVLDTLYKSAKTNGLPTDHRDHANDD